LRNCLRLTAKLTCVATGNFLLRKVNKENDEKVTVFCADDDDARQAIASVDLYFDDDAIQADDSAGINAGEHSLSLGLDGEIVNGVCYIHCDFQLAHFVQYIS
jgi:hypothetical protein